MTKTSTFTDPYYTYQIFHKSENFKKWNDENTISFKNYRRDWEKRPTEEDPGKFPLNLNIEITTKCNLACTFCYHRELTKEQKIHMEFDLFKKIIDEAKMYNLPAVNLNGLGEPITHPRLVDMIQYCKDSNIEDIMFHTNGTVMTEKLATKLIKAGLTQIIFSLDTTDKKIFEEMRVGANFEEVNSNVELFIKTRNAIGSKLPIVRTTMVLTDKTIKQAESFKKKWEKLSDSITAQDLVYSFEDEEEYEHSADKNTVTDSMKGLNWKSGEKSYYKIDRKKIIETEKNSKEFFRCAYLYQSMKIHPDGLIDPCTPRNAPTIGHVDKGIKDAWNNKKIREMRKAHENGKWYTIDECKKCDHPYIAIFKKNNRTVKI